MNPLLIANAVVLIFTATMALVLSVVGLMMGFNLDAAPGLRSEWPLLLGAAALFTVATAVSGLAWWSLRRRWRTWPWFQGLMWAVVVFIALLIRRGLTA
ncbi:hypothetical protein JN531_013770 [Flagellatimonas centrodinii]|uniref:hypothetical protein n=1 Tax=Flagellatimonas centrodinii TaxID=2806210 RepID=UPI001FEFF8AF|nr:hypothetical protein [Flagellatimonas centrodinii]ULQ46162.1 hypothetical protein JN531_013770 [Flagellatimonas centrodinii]